MAKMTKEEQKEIYHLIDKYNKENRETAELIRKLQDKLVKARAVDPKHATNYCSFCGRPSTEVAILIAGPTVFICDGCVELCVDIIGAQRQKHKAVEIELSKEKG